MSLNTKALNTARQIFNHLEREDPEGAYDIVENLPLEEMQAVESGLVYIAAAIDVAIQRKIRVN